MSDEIRDGWSICASTGSEMVRLMDSVHVWLKRSSDEFE